MTGTIILYLFSIPLSVFMVYLIWWDIYHRFKKDIYTRYKKETCSNVAVFHNVSVLSTLVFSGYMLYGLSVIESDGVIGIGASLFVVAIASLLSYIILIHMIRIHKVFKGECR